MFDANACAIELLKMKNSEDIQKKVAVAAAASTTNSSLILPGESMEVEDTNELQTKNSTPVETETCDEDILQKQQSSENTTPSITEESSNNENLPKLVLNLEDAVAPEEGQDQQMQEESASASMTTVPGEEEAPSNKSLDKASSSSVPSASESANVSGTGSQLNTATTTSSATSMISLTEDGDRMTIDSSSEEEDDIYLSQFSKDSMGSGHNDPSSMEEAVIKRNTSYLIQRYNSLMHRLQGIMQATAGRHISKQLKAVLEYPGLNQIHSQNQKGVGINGPNATRIKGMNASYLQDNSSDKLTKQGVSEIQFCAKLMTNIVRHSMSNQMNLSNDSGTEESDSDDDEVVLPDERLMADPSTIRSGRLSYLPVENNPFIEAIKLEKQYEAKRTSLECSINECDFSLTKSLALRKHCKASKPLFQLKKPATSSKVINIPVDAASSVKFYHDRKPVMTRRCIDFDDGCSKTNSNSDITSLDISRVSDMMHDQENVRIGDPITNNEEDNNGNANESGGSENSSPEKKLEDCENNKNKICTETEMQIHPGPDETLAVSTASSQDQTSTFGSNSNGEEDQNQLIHCLKKAESGGGGVSVLGVEFVNNSDPNTSSSRCSAIKRPEKNRKVFQLRGIQNIFRDPTGLPTVSCTCFGRNELCALCLGRSQRKTAISHCMDRRDKLAILDETFHRTLSFSEDVPLEAIMTSKAVEQSIPPATTQKGSTIGSLKEIIKNRSRIFPPDFLETGRKPKKPRLYDIKPHVESPVPSPKKDNRFGDDNIQSIRKRMPRKSQSSFEERDGRRESSGKGLGWPSRERKDSIRRTRNQEFDIDNIVIPYSIAAATRVEQLVYKPIETPRWRILDYSEIFASVTEDRNGGELEDMSNAAFTDRHNKCEADEKKRFTTSLKKALNSTRKTRRLDSTCRSESTSEGAVGGTATPPVVNNYQGDLSNTPTQSQPSSASTSSTKPAPVKEAEQAEKALNSDAKDKDKDEQKGPPGSAPAPADSATVITEAMAAQALKSLFKIQRRRTISTSNQIKQEEEEVETTPPEQIVDPWPQRKFPLSDDEYKVMVETMQQCDLPQVRKSHLRLFNYDDSLGSPPAGL